MINLLHGDCLEQMKKLEEQNEYLRREFIRMSKGRTMYESERLKYKTLSSQLNQKLKELD
jgi:hypothetical protein